MNISIFRSIEMSFSGMGTSVYLPMYPSLPSKNFKKATNETESKAGLEKWPVRLSKISRHLADQVSKQWSLASKL